jgi:hypothetical protein
MDSASGRFYKCSFLVGEVENLVHLLALSEKEINRGPLMNKYTHTATYSANPPGKLTPKPSKFSQSRDWPRRQKKQVSHYFVIHCQAHLHGDGYMRYALNLQALWDLQHNDRLLRNLSPIFPLRRQCQRFRGLAQATNFYPQSTVACQ